MKSSVLPAALAASLVLAACAGSGGTSVSGRSLHTLESFTGFSTHGIDEDGALVLTSSTGTRCDGPYRQVEEDHGGEIAPDGAQPQAGRAGVATLTCGDGRTGQIRFVVGRTSAVGTGMIGPDIFMLTID